MLKQDPPCNPSEPIRPTPSTGFHRASPCEQKDRRRGRAAARFCVRDSTLFERLYKIWPENVQEVGDLPSRQFWIDRDRLKAVTVRHELHRIKQGRCRRRQKCQILRFSMQASGTRSPHQTDRTRDGA